LADALAFAFDRENEAHPGVLPDQVGKILESIVFPRTLLGFLLNQLGLVEHQNEIPVAKSLFDPGQKIMAKGMLRIGKELIPGWQLDFDVSVPLQSLLDSGSYFPQKALRAIERDTLGVNEDRDVLLTQLVANLVED
jgi:hypothetical protein